MDKHYVRTFYFKCEWGSLRSGFYVEVVCDLVDGSSDLAWFRDRKDAIAYGQMKAHCLCVDFHQDIPEEKTKKKKRAKPK